MRFGISVGFQVVDSYYEFLFAPHSIITYPYLPEQGSI